MNSPIIFCHYGNSDYLKFSLKSARFFNPNADIILLGDSSNKTLAIDENIRHEFLDNYDNHSIICDFEKVSFRKDFHSS